MSLYSLISSLLSYVFTTIIYLFIFSVIALIYMDIKKMNRGADEADEGEYEDDAACDHDDEYDDDDDEDDEDDTEEEDTVPRRSADYGEHTAVLRTVRNKNAAECGMKTFYRIGEEATIVGRGKECDITVNDIYLSVEHFQIWYEDGVWYIADMGSKNGTMLNGKTLDKVRTLHSGDDISFGGVSVIFEEEQE